MFDLNLFLGKLTDLLDVKNIHEAFGPYELEDSKFIELSVKITTICGLCEALMEGFEYNRLHRRSAYVTAEIVDQAAKVNAYLQNFLEKEWKRYGA